MIEKTILDYLDEHLTVPVYMEEPIDKPASYVLIERTGSSESDLIESTTLALQSYGASLYDAAVLNMAVKARIKQAVELPSVSAVYINSDYNFTDTETKRYRYQCVAVVTHFER
jgi:hypothetical protein